jgi:superfamily II DNA or RNA helicase
MILRPYQVEAVNRIVADVRAGVHTSGLIILPTGTGKTAVLMRAALALRPMRVIVIAHRRELLRQAEEAAVAWGWPADSVRAYDRGDYQAPLIVASVQTLSRSTIGLAPGALVIIDEAHHATSPSYQAVLAALVPRYVLGVTATPYRLDGVGLRHVFGERPLYTLDLRDAISDGWLVAPRVYAVRSSCCLDGVAVRAGDLAASDLASEIDNPARNGMIAQVWADACEHRRTLAYCITVDHAHNLAAAMCAKGCRAMAIDGTMAMDARDRLIDIYRRGSIDCLTSCEILTEGFDAPATSCVIMARPTASRGLYVQCVGRGLRLAPDKRDCLVIDVIDQSRRHSLRLHDAVSALGGISPEDALAGRETRFKRNLDPMAEVDSIVQAQADEARQAQVYPVEWTAEDRTPRWAREELSLLGYEESAIWQGRIATGKQLSILRRLGFEVSSKLGRELTQGEASHLIDRAMVLDRTHPDPPGAGLVWKLKQAGVWREGMTRFEAIQAMRKSMAMRARR